MFIDRMLRVAEPIPFYTTTQPPSPCVLMIGEARIWFSKFRISYTRLSAMQRLANFKFPMESFRPRAETFTTPVNFVIPGTLSPLDDRARFEASKFVQAQGAISATRDQRAPLPAILPIGGVMSVWKAAAMSSAAGGFLASTVTAVTAIKRLFGGRRGSLTSRPRNGRPSNSLWRTWMCSSP